MWNQVILLACQLIFDMMYALPEHNVLRQRAVEHIQGVHNRCMRAIAYAAAYIGQRHVRILLGKIHSHLTGYNHVTLTTLRVQRLGRYMELLAYGIGYVCQITLTRLEFHDTSYHLGSKFHINLTVADC